MKDYKFNYDNDGNRTSIATRTVLLPPNKVKILWYTYEGKLIDESYDGNLRSYMFEVEAEGIDKTLVESVEFPKISYDTNEDYLVKIVAKVMED